MYLCVDCGIPLHSTCMFRNNAVIVPLAFANSHLNWSEDQWAHVFFSDETNFYLGHHGRTYVRRPVGESHNAKYMKQEGQLHGKVSLWGCICAKGLGYAELYEGALNSNRHRDILRHNLIPSFKDFYPTGPWIFQQDNVRIHTTPDTVTYLHEKGVTLIEWAPWSPDLNPRECMECAKIQSVCSIPSDNGRNGKIHP
jgi:hypothetical protein